MPTLKALVLGECDDIVAPLFIGETDVQRLTKTNSLVAIQEKMKSEKDYMTASELLHEVYRAALDDGLVFTADAYGGYSIKTTKNFPQNTELKHPVGLLAKIYDAEASFIESTSIIGATAVCGRDRILCGATRFVNSSCRPNCRYVVRNYKGHSVIKLLTVQSITSGSELTVNYGDQFFEGQCRCPHNDLHPKTIAICQTQASSFRLHRKCVAKFDFGLKLKKRCRTRDRYILGQDLRPVSESEDENLFMNSPGDDGEHN